MTMAGGDNVLLDFLILLLFLAFVALILLPSEFELSNRLWAARRKRWALGGWDPAYPDDDVKRAAARKSMRIDA